MELQKYRPRFPKGLLGVSDFRAAQRATIQELQAQETDKREIAKLLHLSRQIVRKVLKANSTAVPKIEREEKAAPHRQQILELLHPGEPIP